MENNQYKILLVDDEPDILEFLSFNLKKEGFQIYTSNNGREAVKIATEIKPHLIILDVMMPDMDGIETCREIRSNENLKNVLITFLTARGEDYSQIAGFEAGADDYITKPIKPRVLVSRVNALLRRYQEAGPSNAEAQQIVIGDIVIDREAYIVKLKGEEFHLPKKEFELLALLASKPGKVYSREKILKKVWGDDVVVGDRTIDVHIRKLREKLGDEYIRTVKGVGYKFEF
ncbi:MAG: response regulator transcription factor [Flavobacteriales bacterium]|nr:response regulator transcription factor [Flavobacteriales bacterium]